jgi:hypothetical protein
MTNHRYILQIINTSRGKTQGITILIIHQLSSLLQVWVLLKLVEFGSWA